MNTFDNENSPYNNGYNNVQPVAVEKRKSPLGAIAAVICVLVIAGGGLFVLFKADGIRDFSSGQNERPKFEIVYSHASSDNEQKEPVSSKENEQDDIEEDLDQADVPDVKTMDVDYAKEKLEDAGFEVEVEYEQSDKTDNTVIRQSPSGNSNADLGSVVTLYVSDNKVNSEQTQSVSNDSYNTYNIYTNGDDDEGDTPPAVNYYDGSSTAVKSASMSGSVAAYGNVCAKSELYEKGTSNTYGAENVLNSTANCWCIDNRQIAKGQYVQFDQPNLGSADKVSVVGIYNGYVNSREQFYNNARPKQITIEGDGFSYSYSLDTDYMSEQYCVLPKTFNTSYLRIIIDEIEPGRKYPNDVCISMIIPYR